MNRCLEARSVRAARRSLLSRAADGLAPRLAKLLAAIGIGLAVLPSQGAQHALLIGVSEYPVLPGKRLEGPANDVRLMRSALTGLGVDDSKIVELSERAAAASLPTRTNILGALGELSRRSRSGDWVIVYFSGHGTQVPQRPGTRALRPEIDGFDEVFLPRDVSRWDRRSRKVEGGIVDDEIGAAFDRIRAGGAKVWAIFDTRHAGDMTRAPAPAESQVPVWRYVAPDDLGLVTPLAMGVRATPASGSRSKKARHEPGLVAYFASAADEPAAEEFFADPHDPAVKRRFGVFTYELHRALRGWQGSFSNLADVLMRAYEARPFPTPQFAGELAATPPFLRRSVSGGAPALTEGASGTVEDKGR